MILMIVQIIRFGGVDTKVQRLFPCSIRKEISLYHLICANIVNSTAAKTPAVFSYQQDAIILIMLE